MKVKTSINIALYFDRTEYDSLIDHFDTIRKEISKGALEVESISLHNTEKTLTLEVEDAPGLVPENVTNFITNQISRYI